jgi:hypothetical protein
MTLHLPWIDVVQGNRGHPTMPTERDLTNIEQWVKEGMDLSGGNFVGADLSGRQLHGGNFANSDFTNADLSEADLSGANFTGCKFVGAVMDGAQMSEAVFNDADMTGAFLRDAEVEGAVFTNCIGLFDAGTDPRGYRFVGIKHAAGWRIKAGCRWFSEHHAIMHWRQFNDDAMERVRSIIDSDKA